MKALKNLLVALAVAGTLIGCAAGPKFTPLQEGVLFDEFKQLGGTAIEVVTGSHTPDQYPKYANLANSYGFLASRGTDFHAPGEARVDFKLLPPLPANVTPVWHDWF